MAADLKRVWSAAHRARTKVEGAEQARAQLIAEIRTAAEEGFSLRAIAQAAGLSFQRIAQIIAD